MVWDVVDEGKGPVDLFHQDWPDHLMSKSHRRQGKAEIGSTSDFLGETCVSSNGEDQILLGSVSTEGNKMSKHLGSKTLTLDVK